MPGFQLGFRLCQVRVLECPVCGQLYDTVEIAKTETARKLFGYNPLAICPCCEQQVEDEDKNLAYKRRFVKWILKHSGNPVLPAGPNGN